MSNFNRYKVGTPHLGNILGAIISAIEKSINNESYLFIADLHSLTQIKDSNELRKYILYSGLAHSASILKKQFFINSQMLL